MKTLIMGLLALTTTSVFAADYLQSTVKVLEQDYQMTCNETSASSFNCHDKESKLVGIAVSIGGNKKGGVTLTLEDINNSKNALLISNRAKDGRFWGRKIVTELIATIQTSTNSDCSELHDNIVGKNQDFVYRPWWNEIMRSECMNGKGEKLELKANIGQEGNFLRNIKIY